MASIIEVQAEHVWPNTLKPCTYGRGTLSVHSKARINFIQGKEIRWQGRRDTIIGISVRSVGGFVQRHAVVIENHAVFPDGTVWQETEGFRCNSKEEASRIVAAWHKIKQEVENREQMRNAFFKSLYRECAATGQVNLIKYIQGHLSDIRTFENDDGIQPEGYLSVVEDKIIQEITDGRLSGLLDKSEHVYTDRDLVVRETRIIQIEMDFNELFSQLGEKGIALTSIECPECGGNCELPESGAVFTCKYCNATIQAVDVFEKFKGFLK